MYLIFLMILHSQASAGWVKMRKMKTPMKPLVSIFNLYSENFKVLRATACRLVTNKNVEMPLYAKARWSPHEYSVLGSI